MFPPHHSKGIKDVQRAWFNAFQQIVVRPSQRAFKAPVQSTVYHTLNLNEDSRDTVQYDRRESSGVRRYAWSKCFIHTSAALSACVR
eukprot:m.165292 g.165292  ORF g.165292 m.165292 type:complete len:87 (+) comp18133_c0_seq3:1333-1593(+)